MEAKYKRILLKLSGEALMGKDAFGINPNAIMQFAKEVAELHVLGVEIAIVIGGGNIFRGIQASSKGITKSSGDQMGMLATVINAIAFRNTLESIGVEALVQTATFMPQFAELFSESKAKKHLEKGRVVIFAGGTGNPFFTTDSAAALRSIEIEAEILIKATDVDGIYDSDPKKNPNAKLYKEISYYEVLEKQLRVMDLTAITLCQENSCKIAILNLNKQGNLTKFICGENIGSLVL